jgi:hypothetical protein
MKVVKFLAYVILLILVLVSLTLNVVVIASLLEARQATADALDQALLALEGVEDIRYETTIEVHETIPVQAEVPFQRSWEIPVDMTVPFRHEVVFRETIKVPIDLPLLKFDIEVPIDTTFPIDLEVPISTVVPIDIDESFVVSTEVAVDLAVPVSVDLADTTLPAYVDGFREMIEATRAQILLPPKPKLELLKQFWEEMTSTGE